jgi:hypothetical protein
MAEISVRPLEVDDFSGGITDNYMAARSNQMQSADNFVLEKNGEKGKLRTRYGLAVYNSTYPRIPANARVSLIEDSEGTLFYMNGRNGYYVNAGWQTLAGPTGNAMLSAGAGSDYLSTAKWNKHLLATGDALSEPMKVFNDGSWRVRNLGLPFLSVSGVTITPGANTGKSFVYAFIRTDSYTIGTVTFREVSTPTFKQVSNADDPNVNANAIASIPVLANGATSNYNTTSSKVEIYRTVNAGSVFYYVGEVTNGTTSFNDNVSDATIQNNALLYTEGGVVDFDQAPPCKYIVQANDIAWYLHVKEGSVTYPNRIRQSIKGALYAAPEDFYDDLDDEIVGGSSVGIYPIIFCRSKIYRLEGFFDEFGRNGFIKREISNIVGCVSNRSIVRTKEGLFFAASDGFYFTDGFSLTLLTDEIPVSYLNLVSSATAAGYIYGAYDRLERRVWWAAQNNSSSTETDIVYVFDLKWGITTKTPCTTLSGGDNGSNFSPSALHFYDGAMLHGDRRGYVLKYDKDQLDDVQINTSTSVSNWSELAVIPDYRSPAFDFGTTVVRKWVPRITTSFDNLTNVSILIQSNNDNTGVFTDLQEIKTNNNNVWGSASAIWGDQNDRWNYAAVIPSWRRFPAGGLRCLYKQIRITRFETLIEDSTTLGTVTLDGTTNTVALDDSSKDWVTDPVDYYIFHSLDNYENGFKVLSISGDILTVEDVNNILPSGTGVSFELRGKRKGEALKILSYTITAAPLSMTQESYRA